jgi:YesN/AraC family two-component response regulator
MPGMNGIDFLTLASEQQPQTLRILLSGHAPGKEIETSLESGIASTFISKPWDNDQLLALVENWIADKAARDDCRGK